MPGFVHLHVHTQYSILDGAIRLKDLVHAVETREVKACAITDHGVMHGAVDYINVCKKLGGTVKPILGCELNITHAHPDSPDKIYHLTMLCRTLKGYENALAMLSKAYIENYDEIAGQGNVKFEWLRDYAEGLTFLSGDLGSEIAQTIMRGGDVSGVIGCFRDVIEPGQFYLEVMDNSFDAQKKVNECFKQMSKRLDLPLMATNDAHYLKREEALAHAVLVCMALEKRVDLDELRRYVVDDFYLKSDEEMYAAFSDVPEACENTVKFAESVDCPVRLGPVFLPQYKVPQSFLQSHQITDRKQGIHEYFKEVARSGLDARLESFKKAGKVVDEAVYRERLEREIGVITQMDFPGYFLIVWDFIHYAKSHGIMVGPGRGSGAGSIVAYTLGITMLDPLKYQLLFERFLNPERVSMPDIDVDFCYERRQEVIDYVARKYGSDHVSQIITFGTMAAKGVVRDVGRVLGMSYQETDAVAKAIPFDLGMTLSKALKISPMLREMYDNEPKVRELIDTAMTLEGMPRHASTHAAGVLITGKPVVEFVPLQRNDEVITTQYPMGTIERLGLLKMDFLGLRTLTVIRDTLDMMRETGTDMKPEDIPLDDPKVYEMISRGDTDGVFQMEGAGMTGFLMNMKPSCFEDIIAAISLYRPGPMESIPRYIAGKEDPSSIVYKTEKLRPILDVTYGCMVYQEQVMQIVRDLAGYSYGRSDLVRRAMAKKKHKVMEEERQAFVYGVTDKEGNVTVPGCVRNGVPENVANEIYDEMIAFASYAFNKSHAAAYGVVAMQTAWLKCYYPVQFMAAMLNSVYGNTGKIAGYIQYCRGRDISVLPPNVNRSRWKFTVDTDNRGKAAILFGLGAIKSVGENAVAAIIRERENAGPFRDIFDFCRRIDTTDCNKRVTESLIKAGAFDSLGANRPQMLAVFEAAMDANQAQKKKNVSGQVSLFDMFGGGEAQPLFDAELKLPDLPDCPARVKLNMEKDASGVYMTGHPLDDYREILKKLSYTAAEITEPDEETEGPNMDGVFVDLGGILTEVKEKATKKGDYMAFVTLEDMTGQIECLVFPRVFEKYRNLLNTDDAVVISGRISVREDEAPKLLAERVTRMDEWATHSAPAHMPDPSEKPATQKTDAQLAADAKEKLFLRLERRDMERAGAILALCAGDVPVYMHIPEEKITLLCPKENWCSGDEACIRRLQEALGAENVVLKQKG